MVRIREIEQDSGDDDDGDRMRSTQNYITVNLHYTKHQAS